jgi:hypothetical protein
VRPAARLLFIVLSGIGLWLTWGSDISLSAAAVPLAFWDGEFAALLVPGTDPSPDPAKPSTFPLFGTHVHGNLLFPASMMIFSFLGAALLTG